MTRTEYSRRRFVLADAPREMSVEEFFLEFISAAKGWAVAAGVCDFIDAMTEDGWEPFTRYDDHDASQVLCWRRQVEVTDAE